MKTEDIDKMQGHWILAKMGKKVLRPGGKELTVKLLENLNITQNDAVVEFAPGLGYTAEIVLHNNPKSYTGVELDKSAIKLLQNKIIGNNVKFIAGNAAESGLPSNHYDKVFGEAMLTMQSDHRKSEMIREANRILKKGGLYAIHELGLLPNNIDTDFKAQIQKDLSFYIKVNARPLTEPEWELLLENEGFSIKKIISNPMRLLEPKRIIDDEGFLGALNILFNIMRNTKARKRILTMRHIFNQYKNEINAIAIIAEKM
jgi:SAM-dependent methyltransferase